MNTEQAPKDAGEPAWERAIRLYADSYRTMATIGDGRVNCADVELDLRRNIVESVRDALAAPPAGVAEPSEPEYWQWRRKGQPWTLEKTFNSRVHATTDDSEVRGLFTSPAGSRPTDDALWDQTLRERDNYCEWADKLAEAISRFIGFDIGEHSSANNPWARAIDMVPAAWLAMVSRPQAAILRVLIEKYPRDLVKGALADLAGASASSSAFGNNLGALRSLGAIDYPQPGYVAATALLFPKGPRG